MYKKIDMNELKLNQNFRWIVTRKNFFSNDECAMLRKYIDENAERKRGHELPKSEHSLNFKWGENECLLNISRNDDEKILNKFWNAITIANQVHFKYDITGIYHNRIQAHRYDKNDSYNPHSDFHNYKDYSSLKLTCIVFLNDASEYEGGEFHMFDGTIVEPEMGKLVIHPAFAGHQVTPITKGNRYSCVCWAVGDTFV
tara:strand:- start:255 stop:851 length:597 start_codon:yes stop_codon:yes gene_type:complete